MRKSVVFSIYGGDTHYLRRFLNNLPLYRKFFWDFDILLFYETEMLDLLVNDCNKFDVKIFPKNRLSHSDGMFWRFEPILSDDFNYDLCLIRDVDYIPSEYEFKLIDLFIKSDFNFQIMRLHYDHMMPIMGGLFGIKSQLFRAFKNAFELWSKSHNLTNVLYNDDQLFLAKYVYKFVVKDSLIITSNVKFLNEQVSIVKIPSDIIVGGELDRHFIDPIRSNFFIIYPPVWLCNILKFKGLKFLKFSYRLK